MRYLILLFAILIPSYSYALTSASDFSKTDLRNSTLWRDYVYIPVLDAVLPQAPPDGDELRAITVKNLGNAKSGGEIKAVRVWRDDGDTLFDSRLDKELGEAVWDGIDSWDLSGLNEPISGGAAPRVFVTIDTSSTATASTTIRFAISRLSDENGNGEKENSDEGVFFMSDNDGPSDGEIANGRTDTFSSAAKCAANKLGPRAPAYFKVERTGNSGELKLSWTKPVDVDFFSVDIYRSENPDITGNVEVSGVVDSSRIETGLSDGAAYYYTLKAVDTCNNESFPTETLSGTPSDEPLTPVSPPEEMPTDKEISTSTEDGTSTEAKGPSGLVTAGNKILAKMPSAESGELEAAIAEGDLVRGEDGVKVYVVKNGYLRWVQSPAIMDMYGHFQWLNIKEISNADLTKFFESSLIRAEGDDKVYEIDSQGKKHWFNMTAQDFEAKGYKWEAIYIINKQELEWYGTGDDL